MEIGKLMLYLWENRSIMVFETGISSLGTKGIGNIGRFLSFFHHIANMYFRLRVYMYVIPLYSVHTYEYKAT